MKESRQNLRYNNVPAILLLLLLISFALYFLTRPPNPGTYVKQKAQFNAIQAATELFAHENDGYPPSGALDEAGQPYCGAMKLSEAMMGRDLMGFHPDSVFRADGMDATGTRPIYLPTEDNVRARMGTLLQFENANAYCLNKIYKDVGPFDGNNYVICDVYLKKRHSGKKIGMPILYYKADASNYLHDPNQVVDSTDSGGNIYNYWDNHELVKLGRPGKTETHSLADPVRFYKNTRNNQITTIHRPYRTDSYILISAGYDGEYGTADDICNFDWKYREIEIPSESKD